MKDYTQEEIDSLISEVKAEFLDPLIKSAKEEAAVLAKGEKVVAASKEGGNGTTPVVASMAKEESPMAKEASDEKSAPPPAGSDSPPDASPAPKADASPSDAPPADASASDMGAGPDAAQGAADPAAAGGVDLAQAYGELDDASLAEHWQALSGVIAQRLSAGQDQAGAPSADPMAPAAGAPPMPEQSSPPPAAAPAMAPAQAAPAEKSMPMAMKSQPELELQALVKSQSAQIEELQKNVNGLLGVVETALAPQRKSITSMAQYLAKSESEKPVENKLTNAQKHAKLVELSKSAGLKKSEQDLLAGYFLKNNSLSDVEHLIK